VQQRLRDFLDRRGTLVVAPFAMLAAFSTYFCMYAFRKPFAAGTWEDLDAAGVVSLKTAYVVAQIIGYAASKFLGIRVCSETTAEHRSRRLIALIIAALLPLATLPFLPGRWGTVAFVLNGLPLGMVWGLVVGSLEGRRVSELLLAGLSVSFIVSSGVVKDVGLWLLSLGVPEPWMPFTAGALFLPAFVLSVWLLGAVPPPSASDVAARSVREPMHAADRKAFLLRFGTGFGALVAVYMLLTAYRDYRDNFGVELFAELGVGDAAGIFTRTETPIAFAVLCVLALLSLVRDHRHALAVTLGLVAVGTALPAVASLLRLQGVLSGTGWMIGTGLGCYLAYVPFNSVLFERLMAYTRARGNAVFAIYVCDAGGYAGTLGLLVAGDHLAGPGARLAFFDRWGYVLALVSLALLVHATVFFLVRPNARVRPPSTFASEPLP
jgi:hypothetical protein